MTDRHLEICVIDHTSGLLFEWNGNRTVNVFDAHEYVKCMLGGGNPNTFDMYMFGEIGHQNSGEDFIASVRDHLDLEEADAEETG